MPDFFGQISMPWVPDPLPDQQAGGRSPGRSARSRSLVPQRGRGPPVVQADARENRRKDRQAERDGDAELKAYNEYLRSARNEARSTSIRSSPTTLAGGMPSRWSSSGTTTTSPSTPGSTGWPRSSPTRWARPRRAARAVGAGRLRLHPGAERAQPLDGPWARAMAGRARGIRDPARGLVRRAAARAVGPRGQ